MRLIVNLSHNYICTGMAVIAILIAACCHSCMTAKWHIHFVQKTTFICTINDALVFMTCDAKNYSLVYVSAINGAIMNTITTPLSSDSMIIISDVHGRQHDDNMYLLFYDIYDKAIYRYILSSNRVSRLCNLSSLDLDLVTRARHDGCMLLLCSMSSGKNGDIYRLIKYNVDRNEADYGTAMVCYDDIIKYIDGTTVLNMTIKYGNTMVNIFRDMAVAYFPEIVSNKRDYELVCCCDDHKRYFISIKVETNEHFTALHYKNECIMVYSNKGDVYLFITMQKRLFYIMTPVILVCLSIDCMKLRARRKAHAQGETMR